MSKKIVSKVKRPSVHQKCSHRSSSVGNDSFIKNGDNDFCEYPSLCRRYPGDTDDEVNNRDNSNTDDEAPFLLSQFTNRNRSQDSLEHQLRRLEMINDNLYKHLKRIEGNQLGDCSEHNDYNCKDFQLKSNCTKTKYYLQPPPGPLDDLNMQNERRLCLDYACNDSSLTHTLHSTSRDPRCRLLYNPPRGFHENLYDPNDACNDRSSHNLTSKCNVGSSLTFFSTPYLKRASATNSQANPTIQSACNNHLPNDRVSNSSDTSRQSSTTSQHLRVGIDIFNRNPECGVEYFLSNCLVDTDDELVDLFIRKKGFSKRKIFEFLTSNNNKSIHQAFCKRLDLKLKTILETLNEYLKYSFITGEYNVMLGIVDHLSQAYCRQHSDNKVMGLTADAVATVMQFLLTCSANERPSKHSNVQGIKDRRNNITTNNPAITRESFIELLQESFASNANSANSKLNCDIPDVTIQPISGISRQLASCLYFELNEKPLVCDRDEKLNVLMSVDKQFSELPRDFHLIQNHRYIICHVDLFMMHFLPQDKPNLRERTIFLFNDILIVTKKHWSYDNRCYKVKQIINLTQTKSCLASRSYYSPYINPYRSHHHHHISNGPITLNTTNSSNSPATITNSPLPSSSTNTNSKVVQVTNSNTDDVIISFSSKLDEDLMNFYSALEQAINIHRLVSENIKLFESTNNKRSKLEKPLD